MKQLDVLFNRHRIDHHAAAASRSSDVLPRNPGVSETGTRLRGDVHIVERRRDIDLDHTVARDLVLAAHHRPPESLLGVGHKAQGELLSHEAPTGARAVARAVRL